MDGAMCIHKMKFPSIHPVLETDRLKLQKLTDPDVETISRLLSEDELRFRSPRLDRLAESPEQMVQWFEGDLCESIDLGIIVKESGFLVGSIGIQFDPRNYSGELRFWIGVPFSGQGYASEASLRMLAYGFNELSLNRIHAHHLMENNASGRVLEKIGMLPEGVQRHSVYHRGTFHDTAHWGILSGDYAQY